MYRVSRIQKFNCLTLRLEVWSREGYANRMVDGICSQYPRQILELDARYGKSHRHCMILAPPFKLF